MEFKKYSSIENSYRTKYLKLLHRFGYDADQVEYVVQEKVHGANLSFTLQQQQEEEKNGEYEVSIRTAKRSGYILDDDKFCGYERVRNRLKPQLEALWTNVQGRFPDVTSATIYGELFGGVYAHPQVERIPNVSKVQKGVDYHPDVGFYAFDILLDHQTYLSVDVANEIFEQVGLFHARTLFRGTLADSLGYPNDFESRIGPWLGLPPIEGNICEGVVIRPVEPLFLGRQPPNKRVILKNKNTKWEERSQQRSHKLPLHLGDVKELQDALQGYLTTNRVRNVMSKLGNDLTVKDMGAILKALMPDALEDFQKDYGEAWDALDKKDHKRVTKNLNKYAAEQVRNALSK